MERVGKLDYFYSVGFLFLVLHHLDFLAHFLYLWMNSVDLYPRAVPVIIKNAQNSFQDFYSQPAHMEHPGNTHSVLFFFTLLHLYAVIIYNPIIWCYPGENSFPFESDSHHGAFLMSSEGDLPHHPYPCLEESHHWGNL